MFCNLLQQAKINNYLKNGYVWLSASFALAMEVTDSIQIFRKRFEVLQVRFRPVSQTLFVVLHHYKAFLMVFIMAPDAARCPAPLIWLVVPVK